MDQRALLAAGARYCIYCITCFQGIVTISGITISWIISTFRVLAKVDYLNLLGPIT